jgi:hypothetical protein
MPPIMEAADRLVQASYNTLKPMVTAFLTVISSSLMMLDFESNYQ